MLEGSSGVREEAGLWLYGLIETGGIHCLPVACRADAVYSVFAYEGYNTRSEPTCPISP